MSNFEDENDPENGTLAEATRPKLDKPPLYKVVMLNDDYTPMEFVVEVLEKLFQHTHENAVQIMLQIHAQGKGVAGIFGFQIAETKAALVNQYARESQHPLLTVLEKA